MIYEVDTLLDCIVYATIYDKNFNKITTKELQPFYSTSYRGNSMENLIENIIIDSKDFLKSNSTQSGYSSGWSESFFNTNSWNVLDIEVVMLNKPMMYEDEAAADSMDFIIKRAYRFCSQYYGDIEIYSSYFNVYHSNNKFKIEMDNNIYLKVEKIIKECFPYFSHVTYVDNPKDVINVINNFDELIS